MPDLVRCLRVALLPQEGNGADSQYLRLAELPALCCQAAGGEPEWADAVTAAWLCFYQAAHLMDSVQDQDEPEPWWAEAGPGMALNVASGLFFSAALVLEQMRSETHPGSAATQVSAEFYRGALSMCSGQQLELTCREPGLGQYWSFANQKSGTFFALACGAGARLGSDERHKLEALRNFGQQLGLYIQVRDDLDEFRPARAFGKARGGVHLASTLPVVYAREVLPESERRRLSTAVWAAQENPEAAAEVADLVEQSGASLFILTEIERLRCEAKAALSSTALESQAVARLGILMEIQ